MLLDKDLLNKTDAAMVQEVPEPPPDMKTRLDILENAGLESQRLMALFEMRCWQADKMGFAKVEAQDIAMALFGEPYTKQIAEEKDPNKQKNMKFEYSFNHFTGNENWGRQMEGWKYERYVEQRRWYLPPFSRNVLKWRMVGGPMDYLKIQIPYGVVLRTQELRKLKLFNCFMVFAPEEAFSSLGKIDPIVVGRISECAKDSDGAQLLCRGQQALYFVAQWR